MIFPASQWSFTRGNLETSLHKQCRGKKNKKTTRKRKKKKRKACTSFALPVTRREYFFLLFSHYNNGFTALEKSASAPANGAWHAEALVFVATAPLQRKSFLAFFSLPLTVMKWVFPPFDSTPLAVYYSLTWLHLCTDYFIETSFYSGLWVCLQGYLFTKQRLIPRTHFFWNLISLIRTRPFALHLSDK